LRPPFQSSPSKFIILFNQQAYAATRPRNH